MSDPMGPSNVGTGSAHGAAYWRTLFERILERGPDASDELSMLSGLTRRSFLQLLGASASLAGLGVGCFESPEAKILPYVDRPPEVTPGVGTFYATTFELDGFGTGVVAESREGRPVKVEGNPRHPASLGATSVFDQAALLGLYDPFRARGVTRDHKPAAFDDLVPVFSPGSEASSGSRGRKNAGADTRFLLEPTASPLVATLIANAPASVRFHYHAPLHGRACREGATLATGREGIQPLPDLSRASVVLALDADPLGAGPFHLRHARDFADGRRLRAPGDRMNRLYVVEPAPSVTGNAADHLIRRRSTAIPPLLAALLCEVARTRGAWPELVAVLEPLAAREADTKLVQSLARDLASHRGEALVLVGERQPAPVHAMAYALDALLDGLGGSLRFVESRLLEAREPESGIDALVDDMRAGRVSKLVVLGGNPVRDAPAELDFGSALENVDHSLCLAPFAHETATRCAWHVAELHALESWGDARALDGTVSVVQPLIAPLYEGRSRPELLATLLGESTTDARRRVQGEWAPGDPDRWHEILETGVVSGSAATPVTARLDAAALAQSLATRTWPEVTEDDAVELVFRRDACVHDGRFADNAWLQELPDPITKLTWDDAVWVAPRTAERLGVRDGDWLSLRRDDRRVEIPALVVPGQADDSLLVSLGYGRGPELPIADGVGVDVGPLRAADHPVSTDVVAEPVAGREPHPFARTQTHDRLHGRSVVRELTLDRLADERGESRTPDSLYEPPDNPPPQWGMSIDQTVCTGCEACVVACQAENNVPVVGRENVRLGRAMHWIRVDRYLEGPEDDPRAISQPMPCQHCEMAPCEYVCPVEATVHSRDGLNEMIYNRCIGTRFCSNNCPYKVRRFNWLDFNEGQPETRRMQFNPDVTVRARGVMEKCTYCVQRIRRAGIRARNEHRAIEDGEVVTACQQACPTRAIRFGDVADPSSAVSRILRAPHAHAVLGEVGTRPRTRYLARVRNPHPDLDEEL